MGFSTIQGTLAGLLALSACSSVGGPDHRMLRASDGAPVDWEAQVQELGDAHVVFLGEEHDATEIHRMQLELTRRLLEHHGQIAISMEMFERDSQNAIDMYVDGSIDEEQFLELASTWPNYAEDYAPAIELAREHGLRVIAANCHRPLASRTAKEGLLAVLGSPWAALRVDASPGAYQDRFYEAMNGVPGHGGGLPTTMMERFFESQCIKDATMAESIERYFDELGPGAPPVVHWCGRFHSDFRLGTVERLQARRPDLRLAVISGEKDASLGREREPEDAERADFLWYVRP